MTCVDYDLKPLIDDLPAKRSSIMASVERGVNGNGEGDFAERVALWRQFRALVSSTKHNRLTCI